METETAQTVVKIYAVLSWISAAFGVIGGLLLFLFTLFMGSMMSIPNVPGGVTVAVGGLFTAIAILLIALGVVYFLIGKGLWNRRPWARIAAIVVSVISLPGIPIGTIIGGVGLWLFAFEPTVAALFSETPVAPPKGQKRGPKAR